MSEQDQIYMQAAIALAKQAAENGEVPVGAIVVKDGEITGSQTSYKYPSKSPKLPSRS
ncbi:MAG: hypothetical protein EBU69_03950 [Methylophilaceae bacterium]|nr:hypothetical protein [Methylophilaceae bacterium]